MGEERRTLVLMNLASMMEKADEALLPVVYKELGEALLITPAGLGSLTMYGSVVQGLCYPLAAYIASRYNRPLVITLGALLWSFATFLVAISTTFIQMAISRVLNGIGLALVIPSIQSLVADSTDETTRGSAFGWLACVGWLGSVVGGAFPILLAPTTFFGVAGWRVAFHIVSVTGAIVGVFVWYFAVDPHFPTNQNTSFENTEARLKSAWKEAKDFVKEAKDVLRIPSFQIIAVQGAVISFSWCSITFLAMWFELMRFSHEYTAFISILFSIATSIGSLFGGKMSDFLAKHFSNAGRIILMQISAGVVIPLSAILLLGLKHDPSTKTSHAIALFVMGFIFSWNGPVTSGPIIAEIVQEKSRTIIYTLNQLFGLTFSSFGPPIVGILAEHLYGYKLSDTSTSADPKVDRYNAISLSKAIFTIISISMVLCFPISSLLYCNYRKDRDRARMESLIASEIQECQ